MRARAAMNRADFMMRLYDDISLFLVVYEEKSVSQARPVVFDPKAENEWTVEKVRECDGG